MGKVCALVEQFFSQAAGESIAKAVANLQPRQVTAAFSVAPPGCAVARATKTKMRSRITTMSGSSRETLELIASWAEILTAAFGILAATAAVVYLLANKPLKKLESHDNDVLRGRVAEAQRALLLQQERADLAAGKLAGLEQDAANAKTQMAKQQTRAALAERSLLELQQRLAHRRISPSDHDKFVAALRPYNGSVVALTKLTESEAAQFADDLIAVFTDAKWRITLSVIGLPVPPKYGLVCLVDGSSAAGKALSTILRTLPTAHVKVAAQKDGAIAEIVIGLKPPA